MLVERPKLHPLARKALDELADAGFAPTPDDVLWIEHAARAMDSATRETPARVFGFPEIVGGTTLWPPTIGALEWYGKHAFADDRVRALTLAFACANARKPEVLLGLQGAQSVGAAVLAWATLLDVPYATLGDALDRLLGTADAEIVQLGPGEERTVTTGDMLGLLARTHPGQSPSYWLWEAPEALVSEVLRSATVGMPDGGGDSTQFRAFARFRAVVRAVRESHQQAAAV